MIYGRARLEGMLLSTIRGLDALRRAKRRLAAADCCFHAKAGAASTSGALALGVALIPFGSPCVQPGSRSDAHRA